MEAFMDFRGFKPENKDHRAAVRVALNEFLGQPDRDRRALKARVQELTTAGDTDSWDSVVNAIDTFQTDVGLVDRNWALAFSEVDLRSVPKSSFDIVDVSSGLTFAKVRTGGRAKIFQVAGAVQNVKLDKYGGGIGFDQTWFDDQEYYKVQEQAADFRQKYANQERSVHYALITAVSTAVTYTTDDITTINLACATLIANNASALPQVHDGTTFILYSHPTLKARVMTALNAVVTDNPAAKKLVFNVQPVFSTEIGSGYLGQMVAPGLKNKYGRRMDLQVFGEMDITMYAQTAVGWGRYGSYLNSAQVLRTPSS
jgi:hypothetical protein